MTKLDTKQMQAAVNTMRASGFTVTPEKPIDPSVDRCAESLFNQIIGVHGEHDFYVHGATRGSDVREDPLKDVLDEAIRAVYAAYYRALIWNSARHGIKK